MNKLKVALCLSGEARTYDQAYPLFAKYIFDSFDTDVFISTWDSDFLMTDKNCSVDKYIEMYKPKKVEVEQLNKKNVYIDRKITDIDVLNQRLHDYLTFQNQMLFKGQKYLSKMSFSKGIRSYTMVNMFYKNWKCFNLCLDYSEAERVKYDLVIRARPDLDFNQWLSKEVIDKILANRDIISVPSFGWNGQAISDAFAYGSVKSLSTYTSIFLFLEQYFYKTNVNMKPDFLLKTHLENNGIKILLDSMKHGCLRPEYNSKENLWYP